VSSNPDSNRPDLSIVIGSAQAWPEVRLPLESLRAQLDGLRAEVIVGLGHPDGMSPSYAASYPGLQSFCEPGASVFWLRTRGIEMARGDIIAVTEDHCRVDANWCREILRAHREHPDFDWIGGAVDNGADRALIDWANYLISNVPFMPPIASGPCGAISAQANLSLKRQARPRIDSQLGNMEMLLIERLADSGQRFYADNSICVDHVQSHGFWNTFAVHYHNGRSIAGYRRERIAPAERWLRLLTTPILPGWLILRPWRHLLSKRRRLGWAVASLPLMVGLSFCHAAGEAVGYLHGPGGSPALMK